MLVGWMRLWGRLRGWWLRIFRTATFGF